MANHKYSVKPITPDEARAAQFSSVAPEVDKITRWLNGALEKFVGEYPLKVEHNGIVDLRVRRVLVLRFADSGWTLKIDNGHSARNESWTSFVISPAREFPDPNGR